MTPADAATHITTDNPPPADTTNATGAAEGNTDRGQSVRIENAVQKQVQQLTGFSPQTQRKVIMGMTRVYNEKNPTYAIPPPPEASAKPANEKTFADRYPKIYKTITGLAMETCDDAFYRLALAMGRLVEWDKTHQQHYHQVDYAKRTLKINFLQKLFSDLGTEAVCQQFACLDQTLAAWQPTDNIHFLKRLFLIRENHGFEPIAGQKPENSKPAGDSLTALFAKLAAFARRVTFEDSMSIGDKLGVSIRDRLTAMQQPPKDNDLQTMKQFGLAINHLLTQNKGTDEIHAAFYQAFTDIGREDIADLILN